MKSRVWKARDQLSCWAGIGAALELSQHPDGTSGAPSNAGADPGFAPGEAKVGKGRRTSRRQPHLRIVSNWARSPESTGLWLRRPGPGHCPGHFNWRSEKSGFQLNQDRFKSDADLETHSVAEQEPVRYIPWIFSIVDAFDLEPWSRIEQLCFPSNSALISSG